MSDLFAYISAKTTSDPYIPPMTPDIRVLARDVSDALVGLSGGHQMVGDIKFFPIQRTVPGHLLCDGREIPKVAFPELYRYLGDTQGTPVDSENFVLPNYVGAAAFSPAATAEVETVVNGTVTTAPPAVPPTDTFNQEFLRQWDSSGRWERLLPPPV